MRSKSRRTEEGYTADAEDNDIEDTREAERKHSIEQAEANSSSDDGSRDSTKDNKSRKRFFFGNVSSKKRSAKRQRKSKTKESAVLTGWECPESLYDSVINECHQRRQQLQRTINTRSVITIRANEVTDSATNSTSSDSQPTPATNPSNLQDQVLEAMQACQSHYLPNNSILIPTAAPCQDHFKLQHLSNYLQTSGILCGTNEQDQLTPHELATCGPPTIDDALENHAPIMLEAVKLEDAFSLSPQPRLITEPAPPFTILHANAAFGTHMSIDAQQTIGLPVAALFSSFTTTPKDPIKSNPDDQEQHTFHFRIPQQIPTINQVIIHPVHPTLKQNQPSHITSNIWSQSYPSLDTSTVRRNTTNVINYLIQIETNQTDTQQRQHAHAVG